MVLRIFGLCLFFMRKKEVETMAVIYVALIVKGLRKFSEVPSTVKEQVREMLVELELADLVDE